MSTFNAGQSIPSAALNSIDVRARLSDLGNKTFSFTSGGATSVSIAVTFVTAFTVAPTVVATVNTASGNAIGSTIRVSATSTTGFTLTADLKVSATVSFAVNWIAMQ